MDRDLACFGELPYRSPKEREAPSKTPQETLEELVWMGSWRRYP